MMMHGLVKPKSRSHIHFFVVISEQQKETDLRLEPLLPTTNNIPTCVCSSGVVNHEMNPHSSKKNKKKTENGESKMTK
jgi:hypothetical protein